MKLTAALIEPGTALLLIGRGFYRTEKPQESVLFLSGDDTCPDAAKTCRVTGRRIMCRSIPQRDGEIQPLTGGADRTKKRRPPGPAFF